MAIDPVTAIVELVTALTQAYTAFLDAATPAQREKIIDAWLEDRAFWRGLMPKPKD